MQNEAEGIKEIMAYLSDEKLINIVKVEFFDYRENAIAIAKQELFRRGINVDEIEEVVPFTEPISQVDTFKEAYKILLEIKPLKKLKYNFLIVLIIFSFYALTQVMLLDSLTFEGLFMFVIEECVNRTIWGGGPEVPVIIAFIYLLTFVLMFLFISIILFKKDGGRNKENSIKVFNIKMYLKVLLGTLILFFSYILILEFVKLVIDWYPKVYPYLCSPLAETIKFYMWAILGFGLLYSIENRFSLRNLLSEVYKFIESKSTMGFLTIILAMAIIYEQIMCMIKVNFYANFSAILAQNVDISIDALLNSLSQPRYPFWMYVLEWFIKSIIISFILIFTSIVYVKKDIEDNQ